MFIYTFFQSALDCNLQFSITDTYLNYQKLARNNEERKKKNHPLFQGNTNSSIIGFAFSFICLEFLVINNLIL